MPEKANPITDAELAVLECLWERETCTKRDLVQSLYTDETDSNFATVHKLLERLESKGYVARQRTSPAHQFSAAFSRERFTALQIEAVANRIAGGSLVPLVMGLIEGKRLSKSDRARIRAVLDENGPRKKGAQE